MFPFFCVCVDHYNRSILTHFEENQSFYGNLFLTGGDPLHKDNIETSIYIAKRFKEKFGNKFPIWVWTGYTFSEIKDIEIDGFEYKDDKFLYIKWCKVNELQDDKYNKEYLIGLREDK